MMPHDTHRYIIFLDTTYSPKEFSDLINKSYTVHFVSSIFAYVIVQLNDDELEHVRKFKCVKDVKLSTYDVT